MEITKQLLKDLGYIKSITAIVKILWHGDYAKHLTFKDIDAFSASAKAKLEKPGTVHSVSKKTPVKAVKDPTSKKWKLKIKTTAEKKLSQENASVKKTIKSSAVNVSAEKPEIKKSETVKLIPSQEETPVTKPAAKKETIAKTAVKTVAKKPAAKKETTAKAAVKTVTKKPAAKKETTAKKAK